MFIKAQQRLEALLEASHLFKSASYSLDLVAGIDIMGLSPLGISLKMLAHSGGL